MSEEKKSKFGIVNKILALLNIGDDGKLESFFNKIINKLKREIKALEHNIKVSQMEFTNLKEDLEFKIEDAKESLVMAYHTVDMERVKTNDKQFDYIEEYLSQIEHAEDRLSDLEDKLKDLTVEHKAQIDDYKDHISDLKARIIEIENK